MLLKKKQKTYPDSGLFVQITQEGHQSHADSSPGVTPVLLSSHEQTESSTLKHLWGSKHLWEAEPEPELEAELQLQPEPWCKH